MFYVSDIPEQDRLNIKEGRSGGRLGDERTSTGAGRARRVEGKLITGEYIYGADVIRIIRPGKQPRPGGNRLRPCFIL